MAIETAIELHLLGQNCREPFFPFPSSAPLFSSVRPLALLSPPGSPQALLLALLLILLLVLFAVFSWSSAVFSCPSPPGPLLPDFHVSSSLWSSRPSSLLRPGPPLALFCNNLLASCSSWMRQVSASGICVSVISTIPCFLR